MGLLNIFKSKNNAANHPKDFSSVAVDMHSHLIPGLDDGVNSIEESLNLIRKFKALGYRKLITTPHILVDYYKNTPETIQNGLSEVKEAISKEGIDIEIEAAAEYMLDDGFQNKLKARQLIPINNKYILIELPVFNEPPQLLNVIFDLQIEGFEVILAHAERYVYWYKDLNKFQLLKDRNVYFQLNAVSLSGFYPSPVKNLAEKLIELQMIDFLGSDMHNHNYMDAFEASLLSKSMSLLLSSGALKNNKL